MVNTLYELQERSAAEQLLAEFGERFPQLDVERKAGQIDLMIDKGEIEPAIRVARELAKSGAERLADKVDNQIALSKVYARAGQLEAIERLRDSLRAASIPDQSMRRFLRATAWSLFQEKDFDRSMSWMEEAVSEPDEAKPEERLDLGWILARTGHLEEAEAIFRSGLSSDTRKLDAQLGLSAVGLLRGDYLQAEQITRDLLADGHSHAMVYAQLAYALIEQNRCTEAIPHARKFLEMTDTHIALVVLSWALIESETDIDEGLALALRARNEVPLRHADRVWVLPFTPSVEHCLGLAHLKRGRTGEAVAMLEEAARLRPDRKRILEDLKRAKNLL
jgi:tetratricopeptide (TPR) repeat protein